MEIEGKPIISRLLEVSLQLTEVDEWAMVTNHVCFPHYQQYLQQHQFPIKLIDNQISIVTEQTGAITDLNYALETLNWDDDVLVLPSDTLVSIELSQLMSFFQKYHSFINVIFDTHDKSLIAQNLGCAEVEEEKLIGFEEKPIHPKTTLTSVPIYIYAQHNLPLIKKYLQTNTKIDSPGSIIPWLIQQTPAYGYILPFGYYYDVGTLDIYQDMSTHPEKYIL